MGGIDDGTITYKASFFFRFTTFIPSPRDENISLVLKKKKILKSKAREILNFVVMKCQ